MGHSPDPQATPIDLKPGVDNYAVMGNPVAHSKSPLIHRCFAEQTGQRLHYQAILVPRDGFAAAVERFGALGGRGLNVTLPFKAEAFALAGSLTGRATEAGAVNTLSLDVDVIHGDNTDGIGLMRDLHANDVGVRDRRVLVLGAGGAVDGILGVLLDEQPARVVVANRTLARAVALCGRHGGKAVVPGPVSYGDLAGQRFDLVINATSAGLQGESPPLPVDILAPGAACYDLLYGPAARPFTAWAASRGAARVLDGTGMLVEQAAESFHVWRGVRPATAALIARLRQGT